ncbi:MAG TPA: precorrin-8X methylmutase [Acidimicrobiales bacterium]|nr:precorrin-8X methylmutase [Acidimicrobiales bacterium]
MTVTGAAIEAESFRILADRVDLSNFDRTARLVVARVIHASADIEYASTLVVDADAVQAGVDAIVAGAPVITDVEMTRHGISGVATECFLARASAAESGDRASAAESGDRASAAESGTRSAIGITLAAERHPRGAIVVIGCAPTALAEVVRLYRAGAFNPALVIGLPVGFVGAKESKQSLRSTNLASISNVGEKGGSAVAAAALNAIVRFASNADA